MRKDLRRVVKVSDAPIARVRPTEGSRLEQLAALYPVLKAEVDAAKEKLDAVTEAIKIELQNAAPGELKVDLVADGLDRPLRLSWREQWRVDTKKLKTEMPEVYVKYVKRSSYWELRQVPR